MGSAKGSYQRGRRAGIKAGTWQPGGGTKTFTAKKSDDWIRTELTGRMVSSMGGVVPQIQEVLTQKGERLVETLTNAPVGTVITRTFTDRDTRGNIIPERTEQYRVTGTDRRKYLLNIDKGSQTGLNRFTYRDTFQKLITNARQIKMRQTARTEAEISDQTAENAEQ